MFFFSLKFGNNLQKLREAGSISFIDALSKIALYAQDVDGKLNYEELTNQVIKDITTNVAKGSFLIFDKISILQSLGLPIQNFVAFIRKIQNIVAKNDCLLVTCNRSLSQVGMIFDENTNDDPFSSFLSHNAILNIAVRPLTSGRSINVSGNITYLWNMLNQDAPLEYQFRVEEKDVKVFSLGTSSAVL